MTAASGHEHRTHSPAAGPRVRGRVRRPRAAGPGDRSRAGGRRPPVALPPPRSRGPAYGMGGHHRGASRCPWVYAGLVRPWLQHWGATEEERRRRYPGDGDRRPLSTSTRAVTVRAPAAKVWPWLAQIGQDKGGFLLLRLAGEPRRLPPPHRDPGAPEEWRTASPATRLDASSPGSRPGFTEVRPAARAGDRGAGAPTWWSRTGTAVASWSPAPTWTGSRAAVALLPRPRLPPR